MPPVDHAAAPSTTKHEVISMREVSGTRKDVGLPNCIAKS
jgi:hypothetical protein